MTVIYAVICRSTDSTVLSEVCDKDIKGSVGPVFLELLQHICRNPQCLEENEYKTFVQSNESVDFFSHFLEACNAAIGEAGEMEEDYYFHLFKRKEVIYGCLGDDPDLRDQKVNFAFLEHIEKEFKKSFRSGRIRTANAYSLDKQFAPTIRAAMHYHNIHHREIRQEERLTHLKTKVESVRDVMGRNLQLILDRGDRFDGLLEKSDILQQDVSVFKKRARKTKNIMRRKYYYWYLVLCSIVFFIIYVVSVSACGLKLQRCVDTSSWSISNANNEGGNNKDDKNNNKMLLF